MEKPQKKPVIVSHYICAECNKPIVDYTEGFHIQGNITLANPNSAPGIIGGGNWLNKINKGERVFWDEIPEIVLCKPCFLKLLTYY